jgi:hypothetical protein
MQSKAATPDEYLESLPEDRKEPMAKLRKVIKKNLPKGFKEQMSYGMLGWVVPHSLYPEGYHCNPKDPLPFMNLASQKITFRSITWDFMTKASCSSGLSRNMQSASRKSLTWANAASGLRRWTAFHMT